MKLMTAFAISAMMILTACSSPGVGEDPEACDGWKRIDVPEADKPVISRDLKLQIAGHNLYGEEIECWEND